MMRTMWRAALAAALLAAAACGGDDAGDDDRAAPREDAPAEAGAFPVTIEHAFGETTIEEAPERVVTWGWGSADAAIALDVIPVAIPFDDYAGDDEGVLPWIREAVEAKGAELPARLPKTQELPVEAVLSYEPDVVLAAYSGLTQEEYDALTAAGVAVVAYPGEAWSTPWRDLIEIVGTALGRSEEAAALLEDIDDQVAAAAAANPELAGKSVALVWDAADTFYVYKAADARAEFLLDLGMVTAPSVDELATDESTFYFTLSKERLGELESDVLVAFADTQAQMDAFLESDYAQLMSQVRDGRVAQVVGPDFVSAVSPPTALSLTWGLEEYVRLIAEAAAVAG